VLRKSRQDNDGLHGEIEVAGNIKLKKGKHPIRISFFEKGGGEAIYGYVKGPGFNKEALTSKWVSRESK
jgi:hypothetical protein